MAVSAVFNVKLSPSVPSNSAVLLPLRVRQSADSMGEHLLAPRRPKADNVVLKLKPSTVMNRAKCDLIGLPLCDGLGR